MVGKVGLMQAAPVPGYVAVVRSQSAGTSVQLSQIPLLFKASPSGQAQQRPALTLLVCNSYGDAQLAHFLVVVFKTQVSASAVKQLSGFPVHVEQTLLVK